MTIKQNKRKFGQEHHRAVNANLKVFMIKLLKNLGYSNRVICDVVHSEYKDVSRLAGAWRWMDIEDNDVYHRYFQKACNAYHEELVRHRITFTIR